MGGFGSGRCRTRNFGAIDDFIRLDIRQMRRLGLVCPGSRINGVVHWSYPNTSRAHASAELTVDLFEGARGTAVVRFSRGGCLREQRIDLVSSPVPYGGRRYYFLCPMHGHRCEVLAEVDGSFASRKAYRLTYRSQSASPLERLRDHTAGLERRLWPLEGRPKPRGRNRRRLMREWMRADEAFERLFASEFSRRFGHVD